ncbi:MAG: hypothetical protein K2N18_05255, partial [Clostridia bacterium]|nr:hypothetical protein [Clostridia bacterium]
YTGTGSHDVSTHSYVDADGNPLDLYIFIYVSTQKLDVDWTLTDTAFTYRSERAVVKATVKSGVNDFATNLNVTVKIESGQSAETDGYSFTVDNSTTANANRYKFYNTSTKVFTIDPFAAGDAFTRAGTYSGKRYGVRTDGVTYYEDPNGEYGYNASTGYFKLSYTQLGTYTYFPTKINIINANGTVMNDVPLQWDMSGVNFTYEGGSFTAYALFNADSTYNRGVGTYKNELGVQRIPVTIKITSRKVTSLHSDTTTQLNSLTGYANKATKDYINAYDYKLPSMPSSIRAYAGGTAYYFYEKPTTAQKNSTGYGGVLTWMYNKFRPTYEGGIIYMTANITG